MKEKKITLDRKKITALEISTRQEFDKIIATHQTQQFNKSMKNSWFWGVTGMATLSLPILLTSLDFNKDQQKVNVIDEQQKIN